MSWLFSQALVAEYWPDNCLDGEPYAQWNVMPTPQGFWRNDKMMDASSLSRFGQTLRLLKESHGEAVLMSFLEGFPARTYQPQGEAQDLKVNARDFGLSSLESLAKFDPDTSTWRTPQFSLLGGLEPYSETWPRWGTMRNGECWVQPMLALRTSGTESGLWPTPNVPNGGRSVAHVTEWSESGKTAYHSGKKVQVGLESAVKLWPTPLANSHTGAGHGPNKKGGPNLQEAVKQWATPTVCGNYNRKGITKNSGDGLATQVKNFPTPAARDYRSPNKKSYAERGGGKKGEQLPNVVGGQLNPTWVEWLMGWPLGWTDLKPLAMDKFPSAQQKHSEGS